MVKRKGINLSTDRALRITSSIPDMAFRGIFHGGTGVSCIFKSKVVDPELAYGSCGYDPFLSHPQRAFCRLYNAGHSVLGHFSQAIVVFLRKVLRFMYVNLRLSFLTCRS